MISLLEDIDKWSVTVEQLQETDITKVLYRVLKTCPVIELKRQVKLLLSKWKKLYVGFCSQTSAHPARSDSKETVCPSCFKADTKETGAIYFAQCEKIRPDYSSNGGESRCEQESLSLRTVGGKDAAMGDLSVVGCEGNATLVSTEPGIVESSRTAETSEVNLEKAQISVVPVRPKCTELLFQALQPEGAEGTESSAKCQEVAQAIEESIFVLHGKMDKKYRSCIRSKVANLRNPKTPHLRQNLLCGRMSAKAFAEMSAMEMASDELKRLREVYRHSAISEHQLPQRVEGTKTDKIRCRRCEKFDCTVTVIARGTLFLPSWVRNGNPDEQMMTFVICNACGEKWYNSGWVCL
ncbi:TEANC protein, partial [Amia calva]|nr:TEANC protein [Amia calva]